MITGDESKRQSNLRDHHLDFVGCDAVFNAPVFTWDDDREAYGELRINLLGWLKGVVVHIPLRSAATICMSSVCARRKNMKSDVTSRKFPASSEEWETIIAEAPGEDRPPTPEEEAVWSRGVVVKEGGYPAVRAALAEKRRWRGTQKTPRKVSTTLRLPPEVLAYRIGEALKEWIKAHPPA